MAAVLGRGGCSSFFTTELVALRGCGEDMDVVGDGDGCVVRDDEVDEDMGRGVVAKEGGPEGYRRRTKQNERTYERRHCLTFCWSLKVGLAEEDPETVAGDGDGSDDFISTSRTAVVDDEEEACTYVLS